MPNKNNYWAAKRAEGWAVVREGNERATSVHPTQEEAWNEARNRAREANGEAYLQNNQGQIRERNSYGKDPHPPKG